MSFPSEKTIDNGDLEYGDRKRNKSLAARVQKQLSVSALDDDESTKEGQLFSMLDVDPALDAKMNVVNNVRTSTSFTFPGRIH